MIARAIRVIRFSIRQLFFKTLELLLLIDVALLVEVGEEEQKHDSMKTDPDHEALWIVAIGPKQLELMREYGYKLNLSKKIILIFFFTNKSQLKKYDCVIFTARSHMCGGSENYYVHSGKFGV